MYLSKSDYEFLTRICDTVVCEHGTNDDFYYFCYMLNNMDKQRKQQNKKVAAYVADKRQTNKNYGRGYAASVKGIEVK